MCVMVVRGTKRFRDRVAAPVGDDALSSGLLGDWYVNVLFWRPRVAVFVNERTLVPVFVDFAPSKTVIARLPTAFAEVARRIGVDAANLDAELAHMADACLPKTASRSVLGTMNDFVSMADRYRCGQEEIDLIDLSAWLAHTPCSPLRPSTGWPDLELQSLLGTLDG